MNPSPTQPLFLLFLLLFWTPAFAQEAQDVSDTTPSDEVLRQEIDMHMLAPCFDTVFGEMIEEAGLSEQMSVADFMRFVGDERFITINAKLKADIIEKVRGKPEPDRISWYKVGAGLCITTGREQMHDTNPLKALIPDKQDKPAPQKSAPKLFNRDKLWDQMKELDTIVNQQAQDFEDMEQERLHAVAKRQASVPEAIRQETLRQCKKKRQRIEKAGFGGSSWSLLQSCVSNELDAYLDLKQAYGDSLSGQ